jgi:Zn-dependent alcohol dehydrogenase
MLEPALDELVLEVLDCGFCHSNLSMLVQTRVSAASPWIRGMRWWTGWCRWVRGWIPV